MIKKVTRIFKKCADCLFCVDKHIKEVTGYHTEYVCLRSEYKEIARKELLFFPDWCPLEEETIIDLTILRGMNKK
jgi:hypothetical protein